MVFTSTTTTTPPGSSPSSEASAVHSQQMTLRYWLDTSERDEGTYAVVYCSVKLPGATAEQKTAFDEAMKAQVGAIEPSTIRGAKDWADCARLCSLASLKSAKELGYSASSCSGGPGTTQDWEPGMTYRKLVVKPANPTVAPRSSKQTSSVMAPSVSYPITMTPKPSPEEIVFAKPANTTVAQQSREQTPSIIAPSVSCPTTMNLEPRPEDTVFSFPWSDPIMKRCF